MHLPGISIPNHVVNMTASGMVAQRALSDTHLYCLAYVSLDIGLYLLCSV